MSPELFRASPLPVELWAKILAEARAAQLRDAFAFLESFRFETFSNHRIPAERDPWGT